MPLSLEGFASNVYARPKEQKLKLLANVKQIFEGITITI